MAFLWQIGYSALKGTPGGVPLYLVIVIILSRVPQLFVMKTGLETLKVKPDNFAANIIIASMLFHLAVIWLQKLFGSRFFVPNCIIPGFYNYLRKAPYASPIAEETCSICLNALRSLPD
jgi:hypothetical protein